MLPVPLYYAILLLCAAYAVLRGGGPERAGAAIIVVGSICSTFLFSAHESRYRGVESGVFLVDVAVSVAFVVLALRANRYWPLWMTALQLIGTAEHAVKMVDSHVVRLVYAFVLAFWTYPMLLLLVLGTWRHQRRLVRFGADRSWSSFSALSATMRSFGRNG
jgi:hypothetical protein